LSGIWFIPELIYYIVGDGVFTTHSIQNSWQTNTGHPLIYKSIVRGLSENDVFISGSFGLLSHYNGTSWHHYNGNELPNISGGYWSIDLRPDFIIAVGNINNQAIIVRGQRN
jgi:hypothetical protein